MHDQIAWEWVTSNALIWERKERITKISKNQNGLDILKWVQKNI